MQKIAAMCSMKKQRVVKIIDSIRVMLIMVLPTISFPGFALDCKNAMNTIQINRCEHQAMQKMEKELNSVYKRIIRLLEKEDKAQSRRGSRSLKTQLVKAQRLWVKYREADCSTLYSFYESGTIRTVMQLGCMRQKAEQRIKDLKQYEPDR